MVKITKKGENKDYYNYLRTAEKLYADAIKTSFGGMTLSDVAAFAELERLANGEDFRKDVSLDKNENVNTNLKMIKDTH